VGRRGSALPTRAAQGDGPIGGVLFVRGPIGGCRMARRSVVPGPIQLSGAITRPGLPGAVVGAAAQTERVAEQARDQGERAQDEEVDQREDDARDGFAEALDEGCE
jgi:hypothetical protein